MNARAASGPSWLAALRRYLIVLAAANVVWEFAQMPLYAIWRDGSPREIAVAGLHCAAGDVLIGLACLIAALVTFGTVDWPLGATRNKVATATIAFGVCYTIYSEWKNVAVEGNWAYSDLMPVAPFIGTGLAPLLQWIAIPMLAFAVVRRAARGQRPLEPDML